MLPAPTHVNQFAAGGRFRDGKDSRRFDCAVSVGVMALDAFTGGARRVSTTAFRALQDDHVGGIGLDDVADAWRAVGLRFDYGRKPWGAITQRLAAGDPACLPGMYLALGSWRAPGSSFLAGHMLYLQRGGRPGWIVVNDPLRSGPVELPESVVGRFWASSGGQAGWGVGSSVGSAPEPPVGLSFPEWVSANWLTGKTVAQALGPPLTPGAADALRQRLASLGIPTNGDHVITRAEAEAIVRAGQLPLPDPFSWVGELLGGLGELGKRGGQVAIVAVLAILGLWLLVRGGESG
jgi:hypothetical protein